LNLHRFVSSIAAGTDRNTDSLTRRIASKNKLAGWPWAHGTSHVALFGKIARPESNPTLTRNPGWGYFGAIRLRLVRDRRRKRGSRDADPRSARRPMTMAWQCPSAHLKKGRYE
jgi:hypothetical protein